METQKTTEDSTPLVKNTKFYDISKTNTRFCLLSFSCLLCFGSYFVYDNPAALETHIEHVMSIQELSIGIVEFNMLYSVYSIPNIILPLISGILLDKFGVRTVIFITSILVVVGQAIFAFGVSIRSFYIALLGRGVFGCGGESLDMSQSVILVNWFEGKEMSLAYTVATCSSLIGSVLNDNLEPLIVDKSGSVSFGLWVGFLLCLLSLIAAIFVIQLDRKRCRLMGVGTLAIVEEERFRCQDLKKFSLLYWLILANWIILDVSVYCFLFISSEFLQVRFGFGIVESGSVMSVTFFTTAITGPFMGYFVDKVGKRPLFMIISAVIATFFHLAIMGTPDSDRPIFVIFLFAVLGFGFSINIASAAPSVPYITEKSLRGTAWGLAAAMVNTNFVIFPIVVGFIKENTSHQHGYFWANFFFTMVSMIGIICGIIVHFLDKSMGGVLNSKYPVQAREAFENANINMKKSFEKMPIN